MKHICNKESVFTKLFVENKEIASGVREIKRILEGNGRPGLISKSEDAHDFIIQMKERYDNQSKIETWSRKKLLLYGSLLLILVQILSEIIKLNLK